MAKFSSSAILVQCPVPWQFGTESTFYWIETRRRRRRRHVHSVMTLPLSVSSSKSKTLLLGIGSVASSSPGVPSSFDVFAVIFMGTRRKEKKRRRKGERRALIARPKWNNRVRPSCKCPPRSSPPRSKDVQLPSSPRLLVFILRDDFLLATGRPTDGGKKISKEIIDCCLISNWSHGAFFLSFFFPDSDKQ